MIAKLVPSPRRTPGTMLGLAARANRRELRKSPRPIRARLRTVARVLLATLALTIGLLGFSQSSAQAYPWDDMKANMTATITNMCGPNSVPDQATYTNIDTMAGLNEDARDGYRATIKPNFKKDEKGGQGGNGMERLQRVYGDNDDVIAKPTYERYGFSTLNWNQYGYECNSPTLIMGPLADLGLVSMVHVPMMLSMAILNFVMDTDLYAGFGQMMQPFIGAMYQIFNPWIFFIVPLGVGITWVGSRFSAQATLKAAGWGVFILSVYLLMGSSTSKVVTWATNIVTEVSGTAACKMAAASSGEPAESGSCDMDEPVKAVQQALWYGIPYQTWLLGQVGEQQSQLDAEAEKAGEVGWGPALLNGQYIGVDEDGNVDEAGQKVLTASNTWNAATYSPDGEESKNEKWGNNNQWDKVPYLANIKMMCDDRDNGNDDPGDDDNAMRRWMYNGASGTSACDSAGAGTSSMIPSIQGDAYNKQFLVAMSGMVGVGAVSLTIVASSIYLGFQKMMFFFLLFLAPIVLLVSAIGDRKRRPFAIRYAEIVGANLLKQIAAVCIVLFVSYAMASLFGSSTFATVPWVMKPMVALLFFVALAFLAFPLKSMVQGAIKGDTSVIDKQATAPQRAAKATAKTVGKLAVAGGAIAATGGTAALLGAGAGGIGAVGAGGKGAMMGKTGSMLGQAGRIMGIGSKSGRAMRAGGRLLQSGQSVVESKDTKKGWEKGKEEAANEMVEKNPSRYHKVNKDGSLGGLLPGAHQKALKDAQSTAERGVRAKRSNDAQDDFMKKFFAGWGGPEAQRQPEPEQNPPPDDDPAPRPKPQPLPPGTPRGQINPGSGNADGQTGPQSGPQEGAESARSATPTPLPYERFAEQAKENLGGPAFAKEMEYSVNTVRSGDDVLSNAGLSKEQVIKDPTVLLSGDAYNGGSTTAMDPFHPATGAMNELRFASGSGDENAIEGAVAKAVDAISQHGVPSQIGGVHSIGDRAANFDAVQLVGAMPQLSENASWQERADAAHTMQAAQVAMPHDFGERDSVEEYTSALSRPGMDVSDLSAMKELIIADIAFTMPDIADAAWAASPPPVPEPTEIRETVAQSPQAAHTPESDTSPRLTEHPDPSESVRADDLVEPVEDSGGLVYRPGRERRKKKRSSFFDHTGDNEED